MPDGPLNVDNRRRTEETFFATIGLLGDGSVHTHDGSHRSGASGILGDVFAYYATNFTMLIVGVPIVEFPFSVCLLIVKSRDYVNIRYVAMHSQAS